MKVVSINGSPRKDGNTAILIQVVFEELTKGGIETELIQLSGKSVEGCKACWACHKNKNKQRVTTDDFFNECFAKMLASDGIILGSPVFFNNVTADMKAFMDRTWCLRGELRNKIGGAVVVGRRYGIEAAVTAMNGFFLKHDMIVANRGVTGMAFEKGEVRKDAEAIAAIQELGTRISDLTHRIRYDETPA